MHQGKKHKKKPKKNAWDGAEEIIPTPPVIKKPTAEEIAAYNLRIKKKKEKKKTKTKMKVKKNG
tara:strand:+ start:2520 stop:2711 length:192 start_codon:yes stop_codon:yes gene_type:complete